MTGNRQLGIFDKLVLWLNYLAVIALLISYLAPVTDPRKMLWPAAFFGLAYPPIILTNLLFVVYWSLRRKLWFLLSLICIVANWNVLNNNIGLRLPVTDAPQDSSTLRVMSYNVHSFRKLGNEWNIFTTTEITDIVRHQQPAILCTEEFFSSGSGKFAMVDSFKRAMNAKHSYFATFPPGGSSSIGMGIFSKHPIVSTGVVWLNKQRSLNQCIYADVKLKNDTMRVYAVHLQSIKLNGPDYRYLDSVSKKGKTDIESSKRIGAKLKYAFGQRARQVEAIKDHMAQCPYPYIVTGDFNDTPTSFAVNKMASGLKNAFREKGSGLGRTYNGSFPNYQIDYIMTTRHFDILSYGVVKKRLSDHYPVYSDVRLRGRD